MGAPTRVYFYLKNFFSHGQTGGFVKRGIQSCVAAADGRAVCGRPSDGRVLCGRPSDGRETVSPSFVIARNFRAAAETNESVDQRDNDPIKEIRTFKSVYGNPPPEPAWYQPFSDKWKRKEEEWDLKMQLRRQKEERSVIMEVGLKDAVLYMQHPRTLMKVGGIPCVTYSLAYVVILLFGDVAFVVPAILMCTYLNIFILYRHLSTICTHIGHDPRTQVYSADFPFRWINQRVTFKKNHVKHISSTTDRLRTSLVTIKGKEALIPKRCFISYTHYDELVRPPSKHRQWTTEGKEALVPERCFISHTHYDELARPPSKHRQWNDKL